jgi:hypothetical protein
MIDRVRTGGFWAGFSQGFREGAPAFWGAFATAGLAALVVLVVLL